MNTLDRIKIEVQQWKYAVAVFGVFLCGCLLSFFMTSMYYGGIIDKRVGAYDRQVDRLNALLVEANTNTRLTLDYLVEKADANTSELARILVVLNTTTRRVSKAATEVKEASEGVVEAKAQVQAPQPPVAPPIKPEPRNQPVLPYQDRRIEY